MENSLKWSVGNRFCPQTRKWHLCTVVRDTDCISYLANVKLKFRGYRLISIKKKSIDNHIELNLWNKILVPQAN